MGQTLHAETRGRRGAGHTMLAGARFCNDAFGAQPFRQQGLAHRIIDLVRAGMRQILALQPDMRTPAAA